jgi:hypothetical protein
VRAAGVRRGAELDRGAAANRARRAGSASASDRDPAPGAGSGARS